MLTLESIDNNSPLKEPSVLKTDQISLIVTEEDGDAEYCDKLPELDQIETLGEFGYEIYSPTTELLLFNNDSRISAKVD